jgi:ankyrin repeat protein
MKFLVILVSAFLGMNAFASPVLGQPIIRAVMEGDLEQARQMLQNDPEAAKALDKDGWGTLQWAVHKDNQDMVELLLPFLPLEFRDKNQNTALHTAVSSNNLRLVDYLLKRGLPMDSRGSGGQMPIHLAAIYSSEMIQELSARKADLNARDLFGNTPLHAAVKMGSIQAVQALLGLGADVDPVNDERETPLHKAIKRGSEMKVKLLLEHKANPNAVNKRGDSPLHLAVSENSELVEILLSAGAEVNVPDKDGKTPLDLVRGLRSSRNDSMDPSLAELVAITMPSVEEYSNIEQVLLRHGAKAR